MINYLLIAIVILGICVIALFFVVLALVRQVGILYERIAPAGALMINKTLAVGEQAPVVLVLDENSSATLEIGAANQVGKSQLLFFVSPDCPVCKTLLPTFKSASRAEADWLQFTLASDADSADIHGMIVRENLQSFRFVNSRELGTSYGISKLPFAVVIDSEGKIASMGLVNSREHFDSLFNAKESNVASLQDYLRKNEQRENSGLGV